MRAAAQHGDLGTHASTSASPDPVRGKRGLDRVGGKWGVASILGSLAAAAGLTAALLSLKGSTAKRDGDKNGEES